MSLPQTVYFSISNFDTNLPSLVYTVQCTLIQFTVARCTKYMQSSHQTTVNTVYVGEKYILALFYTRNLFKKILKSGLTLAIKISHY